jgi:hypothetical protein
VGVLGRGGQARAISPMRWGATAFADPLSEPSEPSISRPSALVQATNRREPVGPKSAVAGGGKNPFVRVTPPDHPRRRCVYDADPSLHPGGGRTDLERAGHRITPYANHMQTPT